MKESFYCSINYWVTFGEDAAMHWKVHDLNKNYDFRDEFLCGIKEPEQVKLFPHGSVYILTTKNTCEAPPLYELSGASSGLVY